MDLSVKRCVISANRFGLCLEKDVLSTMSRDFRISVLRTHQVFISALSRVCVNHKDISAWQNYSDAVYDYTKDQIEELLELLMNQPILRDDDDSMRSETGLTHAQFDDLFDSIPSLLIALKSKHSAKMALKAYLIRLRTGHTYDQIRRSFNNNHQTIKKYIEAARKALSTEFVPRYLGFEHLTREVLIENVTEMAKKLYCGGEDKVVTVWDGTYLFCNKSLNH